MIAERDIRFFMGGAAMQKYARLTMTTRISARGGEEMQETFLRAVGTASYMLQTGGIKYAGANTPRVEFIDVDGDGFRELAVFILESARTNLCGFSETLSSWAKTGTGVATDGAIALGDLTLALISDTDAAAITKYSRSVAFTGDGLKAWSFYIGVGTIIPPVNTLFKLNDVTAGNVARATGTITWAGGVPTITGAGASLLKVEYIGTTAGGVRVYRIHLQSTAVTAVSTHIVEIWPTGNNPITDQGNIYFGGSQVEDDSVPSTYIKTPTGANVTRPAETNTPLFYYSKPQPISIYLAGQERGLLQINAAGHHRLLQIGGSAPAGARVINIRRGDTLVPKRYNVTHEDISGSGQSTVPNATHTPAYWDFYELMVQMNAAGSMRQVTSINRGVLDDTGFGAAKALAGRWADRIISVGGQGGAQNGSQAIHAAIIANGVYEMGEFREYVA